MTPSRHRLPTDGDHFLSITNESPNMGVWLSPIDSEAIHAYIGREKILDDVARIKVTRGQRFRGGGVNLTAYRYLFMSYQNPQHPGGEALGCVNVTKKGRHAIVTNIFVHPDHRRRGIATELVERALEDHPRLEVASSMTETGAKFFGYGDEAAQIIKERQHVFYLSCESGEHRHVRTCLEAGLDPNFCDSIDGLTPLQIAAYQAQRSVMELLLEHGADPNAVGISVKAAKHSIDWSWTPLMCAYDTHQEVGLLLAHGADPDSQSAMEKDTALHLASNRGRLESVMLLLKHGARRDLSNNAGRTPFAEAVHCGRHEVVEAWTSYEAAEAAAKAVSAIAENPMVRIKPL